MIVASNRAAKGVYEDKTGPVIVAWLAGRGYDVPAPVVVEDGDPVGVALRAALADDVAVVLTTGGTGISPTDRTPDVTRAAPRPRAAGRRGRDPRGRAAQGARRRSSRAGSRAWRGGPWW